MVSYINLTATEVQRGLVIYEGLVRLPAPFKVLI